VCAGCDESLRIGLSHLTVRSSAKDVINTAYQSDERIKKGGRLIRMRMKCRIDVISILEVFLLAYSEIANEI
jgi:hypothetical protein